MADTTKFRINGIIDTNNSVIDNLNELANSSGCFLTWDPKSNKWIVILNTTGSSVKSFDDDNIIGDINVSGSGIYDLYNSVSVAYPNKDIKNTTDYLDISIESADRFDGEIDNTLQLNLNVVNNPVTAQYIATRELKQSRVDKIIEFRSNFDANDLKAGDLIDVTNTNLDFSSKIFRIIQVSEEDVEDGNIIFSIIAQEYDPNIYTADLEYVARSTTTGIKSKVFNAEIDQADDAATGADIARLLGANALLGLLNKFLSVDEDTGEITEEIVFKDEATQELLEAGAKKPSLTHEATGSVVQQDDPGTGTSAGDPIKLCPGTEETLSLSHDCEVCFLETPNYTYEYTIAGIQPGDISVPLTGEITMSGSNGGLTFTANPSAETDFTVTIGNTITYYKALPVPDEYINSVTATATTITQGASTTVNIVTTGKSNGDTLNYAITGATSNVTTALTGTVTVNSNAASLTINTQDDSVFNETETIVITFTPQAVNFCAIINNSVTVNILNNATTGPEPAPDTTCEYVQVPIVWCGIYNGDDNQLYDTTVRSYAYLPVAQAGESTVAVPTAISVTKGNPSTITIDTTVDVASSSSVGGTPFNVITSFNSVNPQGLITGTCTTIYGY